jgi:hypothetical protein
MPKRISDEDRVIAYFVTKTVEETVTMLKVVSAIVKNRGGNAALRVGRPKGSKNKANDQPLPDNANV